MVCFYAGEVSDIACDDFVGVAEGDTEDTLHQVLTIALTIMVPIVYTIHV